MARNTSRTGRRRKKKTGIFRTLLEMIRLTFFGRLFVGVILAGVLLGLTMLLTSYSYERFYRIAGLELFIAALVGWIVYLLRSSPRSRRKTSGSGNSERAGGGKKRPTS